MTEILGNDLLNKLRKENKKLLNELSFERNLNIILENVRNCALILLNNCKCDQNSVVFNKLNQFNKQSYELKKQQNYGNKRKTTCVESNLDSNKRQFNKNNCNLNEKTLKNNKLDSISTNIELIDENSCENLYDFDLNAGEYCFQKREQNINKIIFDDYKNETNINEENECEIIEIKEIKQLVSNKKRKNSNFNVTEVLLLQNKSSDNRQSGEQKVIKLNKTPNKDKKSRDFCNIRRSSGGEQQTNELFCRKCNQTFNTILEKQTHIREKHEIPTIFKVQCSQCLCLFATKQKFNSHNCSKNRSDSTHTNSTSIKTQFSCYYSKCAEIFGEYDSFTEHMLSVHKWSNCSECGQMVESGRFNYHLAVEHRQLMYSCSRCSYETRSKYIFDKHYKTHDFKHNFKCSECTEHFVRELELEVHVNRVHPPLFFSTICYLCKSPEVLYSKSDLNKHMYERHGFSCKLCQFLCFESNEFDEHLSKSHFCEKPFVCDINDCEHRFFNRKALEFHKQFTHSNELLFVCDFDNCEQLFRTENEWTAHKKSHCIDAINVMSTQSDPKITKERMKLIRHLNGHSVDLKHKCCVKDCNQWFQTNYSLKLHKRKKHFVQKEKPLVFGSHLLTSGTKFLKSFGLDVN